MDTKDVSAILLKTVGLVMVAYAVFELPLYFPPNSGSLDQYSIFAALAQATATLADRAGPAALVFPQRGYE
jgi:hypothetical protein